MTSSSRRVLAWTYLSSVVLLGALACGTPERGAQFERAVSSTRAAPSVFRTAGVSAVLEKRCGSIDCHGSEARNMRVYSGRGLRLAQSGLGVGEGDTTLDEITANYQSVMDLEPEKMNDFLKGGDPGGLLLMKKPLALERHKGGAIMRKGDDTERCLSSWLTASSSSPTDTFACTSATLYPRE